MLKKCTNKWENEALTDVRKIKEVNIDIWKSLEKIKWKLITVFLERMLKIEFIRSSIITLNKINKSVVDPGNNQYIKLNAIFNFYAI